MNSETESDNEYLPENPSELSGYSGFKRNRKNFALEKRKSKKLKTSSPKVEKKKEKETKGYIAKMRIWNNFLVNRPDVKREGVLSNIKFNAKSPKEKFYGLGRRCIMNDDELDPLEEMFNLACKTRNVPIEIKKSCDTLRFDFKLGSRKKKMENLLSRENLEELGYKRNCSYNIEKMIMKTKKFDYLSPKMYYPIPTKYRAYILDEENERKRKKLKKEIEEDLSWQKMEGLYVGNLSMMNNVAIICMVPQEGVWKVDYKGKNVITFSMTYKHDMTHKSKGTVWAVRNAWINNTDLVMMSENPKISLAVMRKFYDPKKVFMVTSSGRYKSTAIPDVTLNKEWEIREKQVIENSTEERKEPEVEIKKEKIELVENQGILMSEQEKSVFEKINFFHVKKDFNTSLEQASKNMAKIKVEPFCQTYKQTENQPSYYYYNKKTEKRVNLTKEDLFRGLYNPKMVSDTLVSLVVATDLEGSIDISCGGKKVSIF